MSILVWPIDILTPRHIGFEPFPRSLAAPRSISGIGQVVASDAGVWTATYAEVPIHKDKDHDRITLWWAISNMLEGMLNPIIVPMTRRYQPYQDEIEELGVDIPVPHSDGAFFSDGSGYVSAGNSILLTSSVSARAVSMNVLVEYGGPIQPGQHFSIDNRLYRVRTAVYTTPNTVALTFRPPLRTSAIEGAVLDFDNPVCQMKLADDGAMQLPLEYGRWSFPTVNFIEDL